MDTKIKIAVLFSIDQKRGNILRCYFNKICTGFVLGKFCNADETN
jgi:hypothetical protein